MTEILYLILNEITRLNSSFNQQPGKTSKYLTIEHVAQEMNCSENTVRSWIKEGHLKPVQYKGTLRISHINLERFIKRFTG